MSAAAKARRRRGRGPAPARPRSRCEATRRRPAWPRTAAPTTPARRARRRARPWRCRRGRWRRTPPRTGEDEPVPPPVGCNSHGEPRVQLVAAAGTGARSRYGADGRSASERVAGDRVELLAVVARSRGQLEVRKSASDDRGRVVRRPRGPSATPGCRCRCRSFSTARAAARARHRRSANRTMARHGIGASVVAHRMASLAVHEVPGPGDVDLPNLPSVEVATAGSPVGWRERVERRPAARRARRGRRPCDAVRALRARDHGGRLGVDPQRRVPRLVGRRRLPPGGPARRLRACTRRPSGCIGPASARRSPSLQVGLWAAAPSASCGASGRSSTPTSPLAVTIVWLVIPSHTTLELWASTSQAWVALILLAEGLRLVRVGCRTSLARLRPPRRLSARSTRSSCPSCPSAWPSTIV